MRLQDKSYIFFFVDKDIDHLKAQQQIGRSSFINHDPTDTHIKKNKEWDDKWKDRGEITKSWHSYIVNHTFDCTQHATINSVILWLPAVL